MKSKTLCAILLLFTLYPTTHTRILSRPKDPTKKAASPKPSKTPTLKKVKAHHKKNRKMLKIPSDTEDGTINLNNIDLSSGEQLGRELMVSEVEYPQIGIVNLDSGDFLLNIS